MASNTTEEDCVAKTNKVCVFLEKYNLGMYCDQFMKEGYDDVEQLIDISRTEELGNILSDLQITKPGHIRRLKSNIAKLENTSNEQESDEVLETGVEIFLKNHSLDIYWDKCEEMGYDDMDQLISSPASELDDMISDLEIEKPGHIKRFKSSIRKERERKMKMESKSYITQSVDGDSSSFEYVVPSKPDLGDDDSNDSVPTCNEDAMMTKLPVVVQDSCERPTPTKLPVVVQDSSDHVCLNVQMNSARAKQATKYKQIKEKNMTEDIVEEENPSISRYPSGRKFYTMNDLSSNEGSHSKEVIQSANSQIVLTETNTMDNTQTTSKISVQKTCACQKLEECQIGPTLEDLQGRHLFDLQRYLDPITQQCNWLDTGKVIFQGNPAMQEKVDGLNYAGGGSPAQAFVKYFKANFDDYTIERFITISKELQRNDIVKLFLREKVNVNSMFKDIEHLLEMRVCGMLDKCVFGLANWRRFAIWVGCDNDVINEFQNAVRLNDQYSPTKGLIDLVKMDKPGYKLCKLSFILSKLGRNDVKLYIGDVTKKLVKPSC